MKKLYFNLLFISGCLSVLTSCSTKFKFVTEGLREKDSSYLITTSGRHINVTDIEIRPHRLTVDKQTYPIDSISGIKSKKMYLAVSNGELYPAEIYGRISLLYTLSYTTTYGGSMGGGAFGTGGTTTVSKTYYLQKQDAPDVDRAKHSVVISYLSDNEEALSKVRASYAWTYVGYAGWASTLTGMVLGFATAAKNANTDSPGKSLGTPLALLGGGLTTFAVSSIISNHKFKKAFRIYNR